MKWTIALIVTVLLGQCSYIAAERMACTDWSDREHAEKALAAEPARNTPRAELWQECLDRYSAIVWLDPRTWFNDV